MLASDQQLELASKDLLSLDRQCFQLRQSLRMMEVIIERLRKTKRSRVRHEFVSDWRRKWSQRQRDERLCASALIEAHDSDWLATAEEIETELGIRYQPPEVVTLGTDELSELTDARRDEVKQLWKTLEVVREVMRALAIYKSNCLSIRQTAHAFTASAVLSGKKPKDHKVAVAVLERLGIRTGK